MCEQLAAKLIEKAALSRPLVEIAEARGPRIGTQSACFHAIIRGILQHIMHEYYTDDLRYAITSIV
jgi:hypothetical protein